MKLWKKVYLLTLVITTLCVNFGFFGIIYFTYNQMLEAEKERCLTEYVVMRQSISGDIAQLEKNYTFTSSYFRQYITAYGSYYEPDTKLFGQFGDMTIPENVENFPLPEENGVFIEKEKHTTIYIAQILDDAHPSYRIIMQRTLDDFDRTWNTLQPVCIVGGMVLSLGVSLLLAIAVRIVLKPMDKLEEAAKQVQKGNWSTRADIKGNNELAQLGRQFNAMADSVEENIEKLKEQSEQKQELINNLAHEMNTPITSIQGFTDYMRLTELSKEEEQECLDFIAGESRRLKEIASTLLSMAGMQKESGILQTDFSMKELCNKIQEIYRKSLKEQNIHFSMNCEIEQMHGNEVLMESLLRNLITNAQHAIIAKENTVLPEDITKKEEEGLIEVRMFEDKKIKNGSRMILEVSDNGCGIDPEHLEQIFEPFYRVDKARSRQNGGSGLGLPFCKKIVEMHNGIIEVESKPDEGSRFIITFTVS